MFFFSIFLHIHYSLTPLKKTLYETVRKHIKAWHCFAWHYFSLLFLSKSWQALNTGAKMFSKSHHSISNCNFSRNVCQNQYQWSSCIWHASLVWNAELVVYFTFCNSMAEQMINMNNLNSVEIYSNSLGSHLKVNLKNNY